MAGTFGGRMRENLKSFASLPHNISNEGAKIYLFSCRHNIFLYIMSIRLCLREGVGVKMKNKTLRWFGHVEIFSGERMTKRI